MKSNGALNWFFYILLVLLVSGSSGTVSQRILENQKIGILQQKDLIFTVAYDDPSWLWAAPFIRSLPGSAIIVLVTDTRTGTTKQIPCKRVGDLLVCQ
ncbi:MAG: hypothetical protein Q7R79_01545 [bacterium]|nr:hypothetical protein [bacterium]